MASPVQKSHGRGGVGEFRSLLSYSFRENENPVEYGCNFVGSNSYVIIKRHKTQHLEIQIEISLTIHRSTQRSGHKA